MLGRYALLYRQVYYAARTSECRRRRPSAALHHYSSSHFFDRISEHDVLTRFEKRTSYYSDCMQMVVLQCATENELLIHSFGRTSHHIEGMQKTCRESQCAELNEI